jgi:hypothetical protein
MYLTEENYNLSTYEWYKGILEEAKNRSIPTIINGVLVSYNKLETIYLLLENDLYMYDVIPDEKGKIISLCLDRVADNK